MKPFVERRARSYRRRIRSCVCLHHHASAFGIWSIYIIIKMIYTYIYTKPVLVLYLYFSILILHDVCVL